MFLCQMRRTYVPFFTAQLAFSGCKTKFIPNIWCLTCHNDTYIEYSNTYPRKIYGFRQTSECLMKLAQNDKPNVSIHCFLMFTTTTCGNRISWQKEKLSTISIIYP